jgi:hypothetical protein
MSQENTNERKSKSYLRRYETAPIVNINIGRYSILSYSRSLDDVRVRIHNIRSARPEPEIEILYSVYENGE